MVRKYSRAFRTTSSQTARHAGLVWRSSASLAKGESVKAPSSRNLLAVEARFIPESVTESAYGLWFMNELEIRQAFVKAPGGPGNQRSPIPPAAETDGSGRIRPCWSVRGPSRLIRA